MFNNVYRIILLSLLSMIIAGTLLYLDIVTIAAYSLLVIGFFGTGIGILIGFYKMINESER
jgi:hypothetical protein